MYAWYALIWVGVMQHTIHYFIYSWLIEFQEEIRSLAAAQIETTAILEEQEVQLARERQSTEAWKRKYKVS